MVPTGVVHEPTKTQQWLEPVVTEVMSQAYYERLAFGYEPESFRRRYEQALAYGLVPPWDSARSRATARVFVSDHEVLVAEIVAHIPYRVLIHADQTLTLGYWGSAIVKCSEDILIYRSDGSKYVVNVAYGPPADTGYYKSAKKTRRTQAEREQKKFEYMERESRRLSSVLGPDGYKDSDVYVPGLGRTQCVTRPQYDMGTGRVSSEYVFVAGRREGVNTLRDFEKHWRAHGWTADEAFTIYDQITKGKAMFPDKRVYSTDAPFNRSVQNWTILKAFDPEFKPWPYHPAGYGYRPMEIING